MIFQTSIKFFFSCLFSSRISPCLLSQSKESIQYSFSSSLPFSEPFRRVGWQLRSMDLRRSKNVFYLFSILSLITSSTLFAFFTLFELWKVTELHISLLSYIVQCRSPHFIGKITFFHPSALHNIYLDWVIFVPLIAQIQFYSILRPIFAATIFCSHNLITVFSAKFVIYVKDFPFKKSDLLVLCYI